MFIHHPQADLHSGMRFKIQTLIGTQPSMLPHLERLIIRRSRTLCTGIRKRLISIRIGANYHCNHGSRRHILPHLAGSEVQTTRSLIRQRIRIARVRTVGNFINIRKSVTIIIPIEMVFQSVTVKVLNFIKHINGKRIFESGIKFVSKAHYDRKRIVYLVV